MNPLISIISPVYNCENFLDTTINSVINQTYKNWELILVNDGSTDSSAKIIQSYLEKDTRIILISKENGGQASARNFGLKKAKGEWITFIDADDIYLPNKLKLQLKDQRKFNPDFLYGLGFYLTEKSKLCALEPYEWITGQKSGKEFFKILFSSCLVNINTVLLSRDLINRVGYFDEDEVLRGTEDWDYWLRLSRQCNSVYGSDNREVYYRIHDTNIHSQAARMKYGRLKILKKYRSDSETPRLILIREFRYTIRELMNHLYDENREGEIKKTLAELRAIDKFGLGTMAQALVMAIFPIKQFNFISQKVIYRIAYRFEKMWYFLFLR
ncbi:MAG: glycosyltransferase [Crocinitomicaceae bacterium]|nr:glycosyltransferase [Crocinitomicaceae bacterium]